MCYLSKTRWGEVGIAVNLLRHSVDALRTLSWLRLKLLVFIFADQVFRTFLFVNVASSHIHCFSAALQSHGEYKWYGMTT